MHPPGGLHHCVELALGLGLLPLIEGLVGERDVGVGVGPARLLHIAPTLGTQVVVVTDCIHTSVQ